MTEVVKNSTQYLTDADLKAIAVYLKDIPAASNEPAAPVLTGAAMVRGEALYIDNCTGCHMPDGGGVAKVFPPLKRSAVDPVERAGNRAPRRPRRREDGRHREQAVCLGDARRSPRS